MAKSHSNNVALIAAAGYLRRSTSRQEKSLEDQKSEIERYAEIHGYQIVRWFQDDSISGDSTEKRVGFQAMLKAAVSGGGFQVMLVWDQDRFGRFNSIEAGYWIHPLMRAGVSLVTVNEGPIDWEGFTGRMMYSIKQEGKHQFLRDLSRNVTRGQIGNAKQGHLCGQAAPYGYDRMLINEKGEPVQRVHNGEDFAKPRSWHVTLEIGDDAEKVKTLKWLFSTYAETDTGMRSMADALNQRGIKGPAGGLWHMGTIREILRNEAYAGDFIWGKRRIGKYHRASAGEIKERSSGERLPNGEAKTMLNDESERIIKRDNHPALVSRKVFQAVQKKLTARRERRTPNRKKNGDCYILSGLLFCGNCGAKMHGTRLTARKGGKVYHYHKYICSTYNTKGRSQCGYNNVLQENLVAFLVRKLRDAVLCGGQKDELRKRIRERMESRQKADPAQLMAVRRKLVDVEAELDRGTKRLLSAPDDIADLLAKELSAKRRERDRMAAELAGLENTPSGDVGGNVEEAVDRLWNLADEMAKAPPARLREIMRRMVNRIDLWFDKKQVGPRIECPMSKGVIDLRPDPVFYSVDSRGDRI